MKSGMRKRRTGIVLFLIPVVVLSLAIAYALFTAGYNPPGTLIVSAQTSGRYYSPIWLNVTAQVGSKSGITPLHLSLTQGSYVVQFPQEPWFHSPSDKPVAVPSGQISYVVGVYYPIVRIVSIQNSQFNETAVTAFHYVTPVVFVNRMNSYVLIQSDPTGKVNIPPGGNYTFVFPQSGDFPVFMPLLGSPIVTVSVS